MTIEDILENPVFMDNYEKQIKHGFINFLCDMEGLSDSKRKELHEYFNKTKIESTKEEPYNTIKKLLKIEGWKESENWNNRQSYILNDSIKFAIFEHQGRFGIINPYYNQDDRTDEILIYCNLTEEEIKEFTRLAKILLYGSSHSESITHAEFLKYEAEMKEFVEKMKIK